MKVELLCLNTANKPSPISEGVTEIRINNQPCKGINLTTQHPQARGTTSGNSSRRGQRVGSFLPRPSVVFHAYVSADTPWVAQTLSHCTPVKRGKVSSNSSTHKATQFGDSICPVCASAFKCLFNRAQPMRALIDTGGGYHLGAPNLRSRPLSTFPSSILRFPLIAPPGLILNHPINYSSSQHFNLEPGYKKP
jgi:hypothetical protein